jgi:sulfate transport system substrate-binding protein
MNTEDLTMKIQLSQLLTRKGWRQVPALIVIAIFWITLIYYGGREVQANAPTKIRLVVYAFSTQEVVLTQAIFPAFEEKWKADTGQELSIDGVFGPSGTMAGQINLGADADIAIFSNARHTMWLKVGRRVFNETQPVGIGTTPIVIVTRPGNPAGIKGFAALEQPGLNLIHASPRSSGAGEWAILAEYGSALLESGSQTEAEERLKAVWSNVRLLAPSARTAMMLFELGAGDAFVTYEQDAKFALARGIPLEIVMPARTIVAQHVAVIVDDNVRLRERPAAEAFLRYLQSDAGQGIFAQYHQRSINEYSQEHPELVQPFTVDDLGGWTTIYDELILSLWQEEIEPNLDLLEDSDILELGVY